MLISLPCRLLQRGKSNFFKLKQWQITYQVYFKNAPHQRSTIFALSTSPGMSAIAVIRVSGPKASEVFYKIGRLKKLPEARKAKVCKLKDPVTNELLDKALTLWFPSPNSYTGEDICELHIHGGTAVVKSVLNALHKISNFCFAEPGEFTKRAFMAGKLDLTEVEALADLLHAETEGQQKQALRQMEGSLYKLYSNWSSRLKQCLANLEAYIDFSEDQHLDKTVLNSVQQNLDALKEEITAHLSDKRKGEKIRSGVTTVLIGRPNVGKSSLLNNLCKREIAIVSPTAGTTRDLIESSLNLGGYLVNIIDTAGIRETFDSVEEEGVKRATEKSSKADLLIFITEAKMALDAMNSYSESNLIMYLLKNELGSNFIKNIPNFMDHQSIREDCFNIILLLNKLDLLSAEDSQKVLELESSSICAVSCLNGTGMEQFVNLFSDKIKEVCCFCSGEEPAITQQRHRNHVQKCLHYILQFENTLSLDIAIAADNLHSAMSELGKITGKIRIDDILDVIFQNFCIGK